LPDNIVGRLVGRTEAANLSHRDTTLLKKSLEDGQG
jgi:hypothetical protein